MSAFCMRLPFMIIKIGQAVGWIVQERQACKLIFSVVAKSEFVKWLLTCDVSWVSDVVIQVFKWALSCGCCLTPESCTTEETEHLLTRTWSILWPSISHWASGIACQHFDVLPAHRFWHMLQTSVTSGSCDTWKGFPYIWLISSVVWQ